MAYFSVMLSGSGISLPFSDFAESAVGFYVSRTIRAPTETDAVRIAKRMIWAEWSSPRFDANRGTSPSLKVESITRVSWLRGLTTRQAGYAFYCPEANIGLL